MEDSRTNIVSRENTAEKAEDRITLDYGSGGLKTSKLIESVLLPAFDNDALAALGDGAVLDGSQKLVFSTDSFVVSPWRFPGGDIGRLSVCGTVNDLCMAGGTPLISGSIGCHGAAVMMARSGLLREDSPLVSDCRPLHRISAAALDAAGNDSIRILRDPTRGGVATTLNEFTEQIPFSIELDQSALPVDPAVEAACDMLGLDPLYCACEGRMLTVCAPETAGDILDAIRKVPGGENAAQIGTVTEDMPGKVLLKTPIGGRRILAKLSGMQLPRIC